jgi:hypothetical protein
MLSIFYRRLCVTMECLTYAGRAWLYHTLTEGTLQSYLHCVCQDVDILHRYYVTQALIRDTPHTQQLLTLLAGLEQVQFNLDPVSTPIQLCIYMHFLMFSSLVFPVFILMFSSLHLLSYTNFLNLCHIFTSCFLS